jgi:ABC-type sugar transport system substrate-binding protein
MIVLCVVMAMSFAMMATACGGGGSSDDGAATEDTAADDAATEEPAGEGTDSGEVQKKTIGWYADAADSYYQQNVDTCRMAAEVDPECDWTIDFKVGQSTAEEQLNAVEDFIAAGYDAIVVIQNNPNTTSECIEKAVAAGIPYFAAGYSFASVPNCNDAAGCVEYDFREAGRLAGEDALGRGVKKLIMLEGVLGQGASSNFSLGFIEAYEQAGESLGEKDDGTPWTALEIAEQKPSKVGGSPDFEIVQWLSGNWMSGPAQKAMDGALASLGKDGWDGVYAQNNPMVEGVILSLETAGLDPNDYFIASCNGREISWEWAKKGQITFDVNQPAELEGITVYQQMKAYFAGESYRKFIRPYFTPFTKETISEMEEDLIPCEDVQAFIDGWQNGQWVLDINDPKFIDIPGYEQ